MSAHEPPPIGDDVLVLLVRRALRGLATCGRCHWPVEVDERAAQGLAIGARLLCMDCADELTREHGPIWGRPADGQPERG